jgi:hypothetical protein
LALRTHTVVIRHVEFIFAVAVAAPICLSVVAIMRKDDRATFSSNVQTHTERPDDEYLKMATAVNCLIAKSRRRTTVVLQNDIKNPLIAGLTNAWPNSGQI